jgi:hypothetical protein
MYLESCKATFAIPLWIPSCLMTVSRDVNRFGILLDGISSELQTLYCSWKLMILYLYIRYNFFYKATKIFSMFSSLTAFVRDSSAITPPMLVKRLLHSINFS